MFVAGGFSIIGGLLLMALGGLDGAVVVIGLILLAVGGLDIWVGVGLLSMKSWARTTGIVIAIVLAVSSLISLFRDPLSGVIGLAIDVAILVLLFSPGGRRATW